MDINNEPSTVRKERMKLETRYLIIFIAICHGIRVLQLLANKLTPIVDMDTGYITMYIILILVNLHLWDASHCYRYCTWHRYPVIFNLYYEITRILWALDIIKWDVSSWNFYDYWVSSICFWSWILGYLFHVYIKPILNKANEKFKTKSLSSDVDIDGNSTDECSE